MRCLGFLSPRQVRVGWHRTILACWPVSNSYFTKEKGACERVAGTGWRPCWKAYLWSARKSEKQHPDSLITLLILGIVICYVSFFPSERENISVPERCHGQAEIYCLLCFLGFLRPHPRPASAGSVGLPSCPRLAGWEGRSEPLWLWLWLWRRRRAFGLSPPQALFTYPPSSAGLALRTSIVSLVTHSHQTPLEMLEKVGSRDIFSFIPVVKHLVFVSWFAQTLGSWWKLPPAGSGRVGRIPASPPWLP